MEEKGTIFSEIDIALHDYTAAVNEKVLMIFKLINFLVSITFWGQVPPAVNAVSHCFLNFVFSLVGLINVWIILLEELTTAISNCPRQHQPPTLDLLFELLRDVAKTPGN